MTLYGRDTNRLLEIQDAIKHARDFLKKAEVAHIALASEKERLHHSKSFAAAKRASMDLTRALAKMRGAAA